MTRLHKSAVLAWKNLRAWATIKKCLGMLICIVGGFFVLLYSSDDICVAFSGVGTMVVLVCASIVSGGISDRFLANLLLAGAGFLLIYTTLNDLVSSLKISVGFFLITTALGNLLQDIGQERKKRLYSQWQKIIKVFRNYI